MESVFLVYENGKRRRRAVGQDLEVVIYKHVYDQSQIKHYVRNGRLLRFANAYIENIVHIRANHSELVFGEVVQDVGDR